MPIQKIKSGRIITVQANTYVGEKGIIFYDEDTPVLRLSDGNTPGGIIISGGSSTGTSNLIVSLVNNNNTITNTYSGIGTIRFNKDTGFTITSPTSDSITVKLLKVDGGTPYSIYGDE